MQYRMPSDVLHYEVRMLLGLTAQDIMLIGVAIMFGVQKFGPIVGGIIGVLVFALVKRYDKLGSRSLGLYAVAWAWHRIRPQEVLMPRVLPRGQGAAFSVSLENWRGETLVELNDR